MKNILIITVALLVSISFTNEVSAQKSERDKVTVIVSGLGCPFCAYGLEKKILELENVKKFTTNLETGETSFLVLSSDSITIENVIDQVNNAGYTPGKVTISRANGIVISDEFTEESEIVDFEGTDTISFVVKGKCEMCKSRIEKVSNSIYGVSESKWDLESNILTVVVNDSIVSENDLHIAIATAGHDTEKAKAEDAVYENLPMCCLYTRDADKIFEIDLSEIETISDEE